MRIVSEPKGGDPLRAPLRAVVATYASAEYKSGAWVIPTSQSQPSSKWCFYFKQLDNENACKSYPIMRRISQEVLKVEVEEVTIQFCSIIYK